MKKYKLLIIFIGIVSFSFPISHNQLLSNELYITGEDGVIRMYINIMGHVHKPGAYLVYDDIDFMTTLSMAGGYLQGADLKDITIYSEDGTIRKVNLMNFLNSKNKDNQTINLKPHDTIYIEQKALSRMFISSNLPAIILSIINLAITLENTD